MNVLGSDNDSIIRVDQVTNENLLVKQKKVSCYKSKKKMAPLLPPFALFVQNEQHCRNHSKK
jgi:hypothetical protein